MNKYHICRTFGQRKIGGWCYQIYHRVNIGVMLLFSYWIFFVKVYYPVENVIIYLTVKAAGKFPWQNTILNLKSNLNQTSSCNWRNVIRLFIHFFIAMNYIYFGGFQCKSLSPDCGSSVTCIDLTFSKEFPPQIHEMPSWKWMASELEALFTYIFHLRLVHWLTVVTTHNTKQYVTHISSLTGTITTFHLITYPETQIPNTSHGIITDPRVQ